MLVLILGFTLSIFSGLVSLIDKWKAKTEEKYKKANIVGFLTFLLAILGASLTYYSGKTAIRSSSIKDSLNSKLNDTLKIAQTKLLLVQEELYNKTTGGKFKPQVFPIAQGTDKLKFMLYNPSPYTLSDIEINFPKNAGAFYHQTEIVRKSDSYMEKTLFFPILYPERAFDEIYIKRLPNNSKGQMAAIVRWRFSYYSLLINWERAKNLKIKLKYLDNEGREFTFDNLKDMYN